jgi:hypothetical protein
MSKLDAIRRIQEIIGCDWDASSNAAAIFDQMPITLMEMSNSGSGEVCFDELVRLAAHDVKQQELAELE